MYILNNDLTNFQGMFPLEIVYGVNPRPTVSLKTIASKNVRCFKLKTQ